MDTEKFIPYDAMNGGFTVICGSKADLSEIINHVELTRHLQEIYQWYQVFKYPVTGVKMLYCKADFIGLNVNVIGLLSSGKNLVDSMTLCIKNTFGESDSKQDAFLKLLSDIYAKMIHNQ